MAFSVLNLLAHFQGLSSFLVLVYYKLPLRPSGDKGAFYEYAGLWTIYGLLSMNSWFWSTVFHSRLGLHIAVSTCSSSRLTAFPNNAQFHEPCRDMLLTERLDYSSAIALLGCSLILAIIRAGNLRIEAARVMVSAPIIAFISTHILFLNFYNFDYGKRVMPAPFSLPEITFHPHAICLLVAALMLLADNCRNCDGRLEHEGVRGHRGGSALHLDILGWVDQAPCSLEVVDILCRCRPSHVA